MKDEAVNDEGVSPIDKKLANINGNVDALTIKMNEIIRAINDLDIRLNDVKIKCDKLAMMRQEPRPEPRMESKSGAKAGAGDEDTTVVEKASHESKSEHVAPKDEYDLNQRTGSFQSQDVSIDKMFYFGKK
jgi:hypothetical protein